MYLGCNNNGCRVANSLIEGNYIHHTNGPTVEQGDGIELKEGSYGNIIRDNVIHDTNYPGIITYSTVGNGPPNVIEGNLIWNSTTTRSSRRPTRSSATTSCSTDRSPCSLTRAAARATSRSCTTRSSPTRAPASRCATSSARCSSPTTPSTRSRQLGDPPGQRQPWPGDGRRQRRHGGLEGRRAASPKAEVSPRTSSTRTTARRRSTCSRRAGSALIGAAAAAHVTASDFNGTCAHRLDRRRRVSLFGHRQPGLDARRGLQGCEASDAADEPDGAVTGRTAAAGSAGNLVNARATSNRYEYLRMPSRINS